MDFGRFALQKDAAVFLPIDCVEPPNEWHRLPDKFMPAIAKVLEIVEGTSEIQRMIISRHLLA